MHKTFGKNFIKNRFSKLFGKEFDQKLVLKSQSAMEYLMTYGWAILIIAVVLIALFQMGVFNSANFAPKAQPGSCQVFKTTASTTLEGTCNNMLPQYVAQFDGSRSYINLGNSASLSPDAGVNGQMSFCAWENILSLNNYHGFLIKGESSPSNGNMWEYAIGQGGSQNYVVWTPAGSNIGSFSAAIPAANIWHFICVTYNYPAGVAYYYLNGTGYLGSFTTGTTASQGTGYVILGAGESGFSNIDLANVQIYNTSLSANDMQALYQEGIGGAPFGLRNLIGWWPLNGDTNDYSGNNNNGVATSVIYSSSWTSGYSAP